jgi:hypothetical protein
LGPKRLLRFDTTPKGAKRDAWQRPCYGRYASVIPNPKVGSGDEPKPNPSLVCHPSIPRHPLNFKVGWVTRVGGWVRHHKNGRADFWIGYTRVVRGCHLGWSLSHVWCSHKPKVLACFGFFRKHLVPGVRIERQREWKNRVQSLFPHSILPLLDCSTKKKPQYPIPYTMPIGLFGVAFSFTRYLATQQSMSQRDARYRLRLRYYCFASEINFFRNVNDQL